MQSPWVHAMALYMISRRSVGPSPTVKARASLPELASSLVASLVSIPIRANQSMTVAQVVALAREANTGSATAQYTLGVLGLVGKLGTTGRRKAHALLAAAAMQNHPGACFTLGMMHRHGALLPRNDEKAVHLFQNAARSGYARAQNALAQMMLAGFGIAQDTAAAMDLLEAAAAQGLDEAKASLGGLYLRADAPVARRQMGLDLLIEAGLAGVTEAQYFLGWLHHTGTRIPQNLDAARKWYGMAAECGEPKAQYNLAIMMLKPSGEYFEPVTALKWLLILATGQNPSLKEPAGGAIHKLAPRLSADQISTATEAAIAWLKQHRKAEWMPLRVQ